MAIRRSSFSICVKFSRVSFVPYHTGKPLVCPRLARSFADRSLSIGLSHQHSTVSFMWNIL